MAKAPRPNGFAYTPPSKLPPLRLVDPVQPKASDKSKRAQRQRKTVAAFDRRERGQSRALSRVERDQAWREVRGLLKQYGTHKGTKTVQQVRISRRPGRMRIPTDRKAIGETRPLRLKDVIRESKDLATGKTLAEVGAKVGGLFDRVDSRYIGGAMQAIANGPTSVQITNRGKRGLPGASITPAAVQMSDAERARAGRIGLNAARDLIEVPSMAPLNAYLFGKEVVTGHPKKAVNMVIDPYKELVRTRGKFAEDHPGATLLMLGGLRGVGFGAGKAMRTAPIKAVRRAGSISGREPITIPNTNRTIPRVYSKDPFVKVVQKQLDARRKRKTGDAAPQVTDSQIKRATVENRQMVEDVRRIERAAMARENRKILGRNNRNANAGVVLLAQNIVAATPKSLRRYRDQVSELRIPKEEPALRKMQESLLEGIDKALAKGDLGKMRATAQRYADLNLRLQRELVDAGLLVESQAAKARLIPYAVAQAGARPRTQQMVEGAKAEAKQRVKTAEQEVSRLQGDVNKGEARILKAERRARLSAPKTTPEIVRAEAALRDAESRLKRRTAEDRGQRGRSSVRRSRGLSTARRELLAYLRETNPTYVNLEKQRSAAGNTRNRLRKKVQRREELTAEEQARFAESSALVRDLTEAIKEIESKVTYEELKAADTKGVPLDALRAKREAIGALTAEQKTLRRRTAQQIEVRQARRDLEAARSRARNLVDTTRPSIKKSFDDRPTLKTITDDYGNPVVVTAMRKPVVNDYGMVTQRGRRAVPRSPADNLLFELVREQRARAELPNARERLKVANEDLAVANRLRVGEVLSETGGKLTPEMIREYIQADPEPFLDEPAFISHAPRAYGASAYYVRAETAPSIGRKGRTGEAVRRGLLRADPDVLMEANLKAQGLISALRGWASFLEEFGYRENGKFDESSGMSYANARRKADNLNAADGVQWRPIQVAPWSARAEDIMALVNEVDRNQRVMAAGDEPINFGERLLENFDENADGTFFRKFNDLLLEASKEEPTNSNGRWVLVPEAAAKELHQQIRSMGSDLGGKLWGLYGQTFRSVVLATSPKWLMGNVIEGLLRSIIAHAGPRSWLFGRRVLKELERRDPQLALAIRQRTVGGGHYGMAFRQNVYVDPAAISNRPSIQRAADLAMEFSRKPGPDHAVRAWKAWTDIIFNQVNRRLESEVFQTAMLGKTLREDLGLLDDRLLKSTQAAVEQAANGLLDIGVAAKAGQNIDRMFGKYAKFSAAQRRWITLYMPFVAWSLSAARFVFDVLPRDHPVLLSMLASMNVATEEWRRDQQLMIALTKQDKTLPAFLQGSVPGKGGSHLRINRYTPAGAFSGVGSLPGTVVGTFAPQFMGLFQALGESRDWRGRKLEGLIPQIEEAAMSFLGGIVPGFSILHGILGGDGTAWERFRQWADPFMYTQPRTKTKVKVVQLKDATGDSLPSLPPAPPLPNVPPPPAIR